MFSGIVDHWGVVSSINPRPDSPDSLVITINSQFTELELGESIAINGVCLTVTSFSAHQFTVDVSPETLNLTTLGQLKQGQKVNLERALSVNARLGGHFVTGHVDQTATLTALENYGDYRALRFVNVISEQMPLLTKKGSITVNGVSLTLNAVNADGFEVMLIPHTLERTTLGELVVGDQVNLEFDYLAKLVAQQIQYFLKREEKAHG